MNQVDGWLVGRSVGRSVGRLVGRSVGWVALVIRRWFMAFIVSNESRAVTDRMSFTSLTCLFSCP